MYPNIMITNRLQPSAVVNSTICAQCDLNRPNGPNNNNNTLSFHQLPQETQLSIERKRLADYCRFRWHRMEMGGIVCTTGSIIIKRTRELVEQIERSLELDTDGIWCVLPAAFPENYELITRDPSRPKVVISYPCSLLNLIIKDHYTNDQYHELVDKNKHIYEIRSENSIFSLKFMVLI
ncbi:unnamed protein product [Rotaria sp. Silwood1]|nr:unnamed protein product [Rotaria sp. Silwood1]CAF1668926.1 unnamed protein product [Rotaria sp. Silwood1]